MILLVVVLIVLTLTVLASRKATKLSSKNKLLRILIAVLIVGSTDFALHIYYMYKTTCGARYDSDIGCLDVLPGWLMELGFGLFIAAVILAIVLIFLPTRKQNLR